MFSALYGKSFRNTLNTKGVELTRKTVADEKPAKQDINEHPLKKELDKILDRINDSCNNNGIYAAGYSYGNLNDKMMLEYHLGMRKNDPIEALQWAFKFIFNIDAQIVEIPVPHFNSTRKVLRIDPYNLLQQFSEQKAAVLDKYTTWQEEAPQNTFNLLLKSLPKKVPLEVIQHPNFKNIADATKFLLQSSSVDFVLRPSTAFLDNQFMHVFVISYKEKTNDGVTIKHNKFWQPAGENYYMFDTNTGQHTETIYKTADDIIKVFENTAALNATTSDTASTSNTTPTATKI